MRTVVIESPLAGDPERNAAYARLAVRDCLDRGEAPFASHLFFPLVLDDTDKVQRQAGMLAGFALAKLFDAVVIYTDLGISSGVRSGITRAERRDAEIEYRSLVVSGVVERAIELARGDERRAIKVGDVVELAIKAEILRYRTAQGLPR